MNHTNGMFAICIALFLIAAVIAAVSGVFSSDAPILTTEAVITDACMHDDTPDVTVIGNQNPYAGNTHFLQLVYTRSDGMIIYQQFVPEGKQGSWKVEVAQGVCEQ